MATVDPCNCVGAWTGMHSPACPRGGAFPAPLRDAEQPLHAMPASVRELVEYIECRATCPDNDPCDDCLKARRLAAAVRAHYAGGA